MNVLESISIPTNGEAPGFICLDEPFPWHQMDTFGHETFGMARSTLAIFPEPVYKIELPAERLWKR